ncbi:hypothetical protein HanXRQr2_Chr10g0443111 [Helianthus annuus]|uniref:Uncharacterized protein n=1 Tax=Helianthus annuus TaxID=4232 RepID=A0A9K3N4F7_HELAN|nr:hypothetical protein HanXRQr2_Chr10g0443111 [Helianthus annuus]KAJ0522014.1 hypothetical protein HanIR_Chr10g0477661 [Helianthus annuus]
MDRFLKRCVWCLLPAPISSSSIGIPDLNDSEDEHDDEDKANEFSSLLFSKPLTPP